jgi:acyl carrier protein
MRELEQDTSRLELQIRGFIIENFLFGETDCLLSNVDSFLDQGIIDSTGVLELVMFLETTYGISILDDEIVPANLDSINNVIRFIHRKIV